MLRPQLTLVLCVVARTQSGFAAVTTGEVSARTAFSVNRFENMKNASCSRGDWAFDPLPALQDGHFVRLHSDPARRSLRWGKRLV